MDEKTTPIIVADPVLAVEKTPEERLYSDSKVGIKACAVDENGRFRDQNLRSEDELNQYLPTLNLSKHNNSHIFIISQTITRSSLEVTRSGFHNLVERVGPCPSIAKVAGAFVPDSDGSDFNLGKGGAHFSPAAITSTSKDPLQISCLLKFVEKNNRGEGVLGWSVRQMGVQHSYNLDQKSETTILINPSKELWQQVKGQLKDRPAETAPWQHWTRMPLLITSSLVANWSSYVGTLHTAVVKMMNDAAFFSSIDEKQRLHTVDTATLKSGSFYKDRLQQAAHVIRNNQETLRAILKEAQRRSKRLNDDAESEYEVFEACIEEAIRELQFIQNQVEVITQRLDQTTASYRDVATMENSYFMGKMTAKSIVEAQAVRVIALMTFLFLPPTFTCGFLEMQYIKVRWNKGGVLLLEAQSEMLLYLAITLPLMAVTVGAWFFWDWRSKHNANQQPISLV